MIISCARARDNKTADLDAAGAVKLIKAGGAFKALVERVRAAIKAGDQTAAERLKRALPAILWSGRFTKRANDALMAHSGLLCADLDDLDDVTAARTRLQASKHVWALFTSPTGHGLKAIFRVKADAAAHPGSFAAVQAHVRALTGLDVDESGKDVARLCFVSYDPRTYLNERATELAPIKLPKPVEPVATDPKLLNARQSLAERLLGSIRWLNAARGFCPCPGKAQHTTPNGRKDCEVLLDGEVPTIHCLHNSCRKEVDAMNARLRGKITAAEVGKDPPINRIVPIQRQLPTLPTPDDAADLDANYDEGNDPPELVDTLIHQSGVFSWGGISKGFKTWFGIQLSIAVATGSDFLGLPTSKARVAIMNFELMTQYMAKRIQLVRTALEVKLKPGALTIYNLRGKTGSWKSFMQAKDNWDYGLTIIDPFYLFVSGNENDTEEIKDLLLQLTQFAEQSESAIGYAGHFAKGDQSKKFAQDRISGSGVHTRSVDTGIYVTPLESEDDFRIDVIQRNLPPVQAFGVHWDFPLFKREARIDIEAIKGPGAGEVWPTADVLAVLKAEGKLTHKDWYKTCLAIKTISPATFNRRVNELKTMDQIEQKGDKRTAPWTPKQ